MTRGTHEVRAVDDPRVVTPKALLSPGALPELSADELGGRWVLAGERGTCLACLARDNRPDTPADQRVMSVPSLAFAQVCEPNEMGLGHLEIRPATPADILAYTPRADLLGLALAPLAFTVAIGLALTALADDSVPAWLATGVFMLACFSAAGRLRESVQTVLCPCK